EKTSSVPALIDTIPLGSSSHAIIILVSTASSQYTKCEVYEKENAKWSKKWTFDSVVGRKGMNVNKREGDMTTPMGIYDFLFQFGSAPNPGVKMEYRQTSPGDLWTSSPNNEDEYNTWIHYDGQDPASRFYSYENLYTTSLYKYAAALDYNYGNGKVIGKGSAIFMHISPYTGKGTSGCIGLPEGDLLKVLKWMDPDKKPRIVIGTEQYLRSLK
ncbi:MAG: L,D-transpeptidase family protein, partial [Bacillota bacterium]|nr:L,D-transpeptidase family protein [Bacillota bacterium]